MPQVIRTHVFVDMKGYGRLLAERPNAETARVMRTFVRTIRAVLPRKEAEVEQVADTFSLVFSNAVEAIRTAEEIARALQRHEAAGRVLNAGIGMDAGQSLRVKGRYFGVALVNAAALSHRARPGQILVTQNRVRVFELRPPSGADRSDSLSLTTLLFFDMVDSTANAASAGAAMWKQKVERHHSLVRESIRRHRGVEMDNAGDGFYATFDLPSSALSCAFDIRDRLRSELGLAIRAGIHAGECEIVAGKVAGLSVIVAARVMSQGGAGDVLVSQAVKDMLVGRPFVFAAFGSASLKGLPGEWPIYTAARSG